VLDPVWAVVLTNTSFRRVCIFIGRYLLFSVPLSKRCQCLRCCSDSLFYRYPHGADPAVFLSAPGWHNAAVDVAPSLV
jgi:hypothetical protein